MLPVSSQESVNRRFDSPLLYRSEKTGLISTSDDGRLRNNQLLEIQAVSDTKKTGKMTLADRVQKVSEKSV